MKTLNLLLIALLVCTSAWAQENKEKNNYSKETTESFGDLQVFTSHSFNAVMYSLKSLTNKHNKQRLALHELRPKKEMTKSEEDSALIEYFRQKRLSTVTLDSDQPLRDAFYENLSKKDIKSLTDDIKIIFHLNKNGDITNLTLSCQTPGKNLNQIEPTKIEKLIRDIAKNLKFNTSKMVLEDYTSAMIVSVEELKKSGEALIYQNRFTKEKVVEFV